MRFLALFLISLSLAWNFAWANTATFEDSVALVEFHFAEGPWRRLQVNRAQLEWLHQYQLPRSVSENSFYPFTSDFNQGDSPEVLEHYGQHGMKVYSAYVAGRTQFPHPFLLNQSSSLSGAIEFLIQKGVRVFSFSIGIPIRAAALRKVIEKYPEVFFIVSTPHISGNSISIRKLDESPSRFALDLPNVILAGALEYYLHNHERHDAGQRLGTAANPFEIDNQPAENARQYFMMNPQATQVFGERFGATSAAAPHLASLIGFVITKLRERNLATTRENILAHFETLLHQTVAMEKDRTVRQVQYFTLGTVIANFDLQNVQDSTWSKFADWYANGSLKPYLDHPSPIKFHAIAAQCGTILERSSN